MTTATTFAITEPGVYDLPDAVYHADPVPGGSLSATGAKKLLPPSCPALFRYWADNGQPAKAEFDFGTAAHKMVLGDGPELVIVDRDRWDTKEVKAEVAAIRSAGKVPLKRADRDEIVEMANAIREHPIASALFQPGTGRAEQSLFWIDPPTGVWRRARTDWLPEPRGQRLIISDYKTAKSAAPEEIEKAIYQYGYHIQAAWYRAGCSMLSLGDDAEFLLIVQEKTPPYLVTVGQVDAMAMRIGEARARQALETFAECTTSKRWPGYSDEIELVGLPRWAETRYLEEYQ